MTMKRGDIIFPSIKIFVSERMNHGDVLREIECGVEEESVPCEIFRFEEDDCVSMAYRAARESVLEVGIGVDCSGCLSVHYRKLPEDSPLFRIDYMGEFSRIRSVCSNAARLVKGTPFILE